MAFQLELESAVDDATCASREGLVRGAGGGAMPTLHEIAAGIEVLLARHDSSIVLELLHRVPSDALHDFVRVLSQRLLDSDASAIGSNPGSAYSSPLSNSIEALDDLGPPRQHRPQTGSISIRAGNPDDTRHASPRDDSVDNNCTDDLMGSSWEGTSFRRDGRWWALYAAELASSPAASRSFDQRARGTASLIEHSNRGAHPPHHHHQQHQHQHDVEPHHLHTAPTPELSPSHATAPPPASSLRALSQSSLVLPKGNGRCMVIVPSLSVDLDELAKMEGEIHYEERQLFYLLNLRDPSVHIVYVSSIPIHPSIVDYYLSLIPNYHENKELLSRRLSLISAFDNSKIPLTSKILSRPRMIQKIRRTVREVCGDNLDNAELLCFIPTQLESLLASKLQLRFLCSPATMGVQFWGSKPGSRQIFRQCGIPYPSGIDESVYSATELARATLALLRSKPSLTRVVVKLTEGFSGKGNALLSYPPAREWSHLDEQIQLEAMLTALRTTLSFQAYGETWEHFETRIMQIGAIVEEFIDGDCKQSPSGQGIILADGSVQVISTHEQLLGGPDGQIFLGCSFPCHEAYREQVQQYTRIVGESLAAKGAFERYGVDFLAVRSADHGADSWTLQALEINLRQGGTTHPFETLRLVSNATGHYDNTSGQYLVDGRAKYYTASDSLQDEHYKGLLPSDLIAIMKEHRIGFNHETQTGAVFHLMGPLSQYGKVGVTCIGDSLEHAQSIHREIVQILHRETTALAALVTV